jgi:hypothetical protein
MLHIVDDTNTGPRVDVEPGGELNAPSPYQVVVDPKRLRVEAWSTKRLPYEPKGWLGSLRAELRGVLPGLYGGPDCVLAAMYGSPDRGPCDVENVLLYNVGARALRVVAAHAFDLSDPTHALTPGPPCGHCAPLPPLCL